MIGDWLIPWQPIDCEETRCALFAELQREVDSVHPLRGLTATAIARRQDNDEVLFALADGRFAVVHLTWIARQDRSPWPETDIYATEEAFVRERLLPDHQDWTDGGAQ